MKVFFMTMIVLAVSGTLRADDLLDSVLNAPLPAPAPSPTQSVSTSAPQPSSLEASNSAPLSPKRIPSTAKPQKSTPSEAKANGNAEAGAKPNPVQRYTGRLGRTTRNNDRKSDYADSSAKPRKPGGVKAFCIGCCFGRRAALDYNEGKNISPRELAGIIPFINIIASLANASDAFDGVSRSQLHDEAPAYY